MTPRGDRGRRENARDRGHEHRGGRDPMFQRVMTFLIELINY